MDGYCDRDPSASPDASAGDGGEASIDFTSSYVLAVTTVAFASTPQPLVSVGSEIWARIDLSGGCGGARPQPITELYVVPNGTNVSVESCSTSCSCPTSDCALPP